MPDLAADERAVLEVLAAADGPVDLTAGVDALLPACPSRLCRRGRRDWTRQWTATLKAWMALEKAGMVAVAQPQEWVYEITDAGREALDSVRDA